MWKRDSPLEKSGEDPVIDELTTRTRHKLKEFTIFKKSNWQKLQKYEEGKIEKQLHIDQFLKTQKYIMIMMETLFTKYQIKLIKHNKKFILPPNKILDKSSESSS